MKQNKKTVILSTQPIGQVNHSAFVRISKFIADNIKDTYLIDYKNFDKFDIDVDNVIVSYGTFYADFEGMMRMLNKYSDKRFFYLVNEYGLVPNGDIYRFLIKHDYDILANYVQISKGAKWFRNFYMLNFNVSAHRDNLIKTEFDKKSKDLIYWGRFREDRQDYFKKYLHNCTVSTALKNAFKFEQLNQNINMIDVVDFNDSSILSQYKFTIYIEDKYTHTHYNHLADRFYESINFGQIMFFDINAKNTVKNSGYNIDDFYFVNNYSELKSKIELVKSSHEKYLQQFKLLEIQIKSEKIKVLDKISEVLNSEIESKKVFCPNCKKKAYNLLKCEECKKEICKSCMIIYKGFYCDSCGRNKKPENLQTKLF